MTNSDHKCPRLKIAYLASSIPDITNTTKYQRAKHLSEKYDLHLFLRKSSQIPVPIENRATITRGFTIKAFYFFWRIYKTWIRSRQIHFDFVYTFYSPHSIIEGAILKLLGFKWIADIWDHPELLLGVQLLKGKKSFLRKAVEKAIVAIARKALRYADVIICAIMPEALSAYNIDPAKILPITNGIDLENTKPKRRIKSNYKFNILYVGFVRRVRGMDMLLQAINQLKKDIPAKLALVGKIEQESEMWMKNFITNYNLENSVEIMGEIDHAKVLKLIDESDVCVFPFPKKKELDCIYPIKIFEYLALGKPVVATNLNGVSQIIKHEENGLLVKPDDPNELARAIQRIYEDTGLREHLQRNARKSILAYDWRIINNKIDQALYNLHKKTEVGE